MPDHVIPRSDPVSAPVPEDIDETLALQLRVKSSDAHLKGRPSGDDRCETCVYYLEPTADVSYCWNRDLRILVGADWWCRWWEDGQR
jgi:hypothetical protein